MSIRTWSLHGTTRAVSVNQIIKPTDIGKNPVQTT